MDHTRYPPSYALGAINDGFWTELAVVAPVKKGGERESVKGEKESQGCCSHLVSHRRWLRHR